MSPVDAAPASLTCAGCDVVLECCAFCEREDCAEATCSRCLRIRFRESLPQPHAHGG